MREASIAIHGDVDQATVESIAQSTTLVDHPDVDLVIDVNPPHEGPYLRDDGSVYLWGEDVESDVRAVARAIADRYPSALIVARDDLGNEIDFAVSTPRRRPPGVRYDLSTATVVLDIPTPLLHDVERAATKNGNTVPEQLIGWAQERVTSAA